MECQSCQFENPPGMNVCGECGAKLQMARPKSKALNPPQFKYCGECGYNLGSAPDTTCPKDLSCHSEVLKRKGDDEKAKELLGRAIKMYTECGSDGCVTKVREEPAKLS
jgi:hypothetical protein